MSTQKEVRGGRTFWIWGVMALVLPLAVYFRTLCPTIYTGDSGELVTGAYCLGIVHPPGYPLYCLLGRLFSLLPVGSVAHRLNFFSSLCAALSAFLIFVLARELISRIWRQERIGSTRNTSWANASALLAGWSCAFSRTLWTQAVVAEVYSLHLLLLLTCAAILLQWQRRAEKVYLLLFAFIFGLSLAHHSTASLAAPAFVVFLTWHRREFFENRTVLLLLPAFFILGLSVYMYLPLRALAHPPIDWGHPVTLGGLLSHVTRASYGSLSRNPRSAGLFAGQLVAWGKLLGQQTSPVFSLFSLVGLILLFRRTRDWAMLTLGLFLICGLGLIGLLNFGITTRDLYLVGVFFIPSFAMMALWVGVGLGCIAGWLVRWAGRRGTFWSRGVGRTLGYLIPLLALFPMATNFADGDHRQQYLVADLGRSMLVTLRGRAILFTSMDTPTFTVAHARIVEGLRPDVSLQHTGRADIFRWLRPPPVPVNPEIRPIYGTTPADLPMIAGWHPYGVGILYQLRQAPIETDELLEIWERTHPRDLKNVQKRSDFFLRELLRNYAAAQGNLAQELARRGEYQLALGEAGEAVGIDSTFYGAHLSLGSVYVHMGQYQRAAQAFQRAHQLAPNRAEIMDDLALVSVKMGHDDRAIDLYRRSLAIEPDRACTYNNLGLAYKAAGRYQEAADAYEKALELDPQFADPLRNLGVLYAYHLEHPDRAVWLWEQYLKQRPDDPDREDIRAEIERFERMLTEKAEKMAKEQAVPSQGAEGL